MPPGLHRSLIFWLGLFILGFLLWASFDSKGHLTSWKYGRDSAGIWEFANQPQCVVITRTSVINRPGEAYTYAPSPPAGIFSRTPQPPDAGHPDYLRLHRDSQDFDPPGSAHLRFSMLFLPYWAIIITYLVFWSLALFWRWRKLSHPLRP